MQMGENMEMMRELGWGWVNSRNTEAKLMELGT